MSKRRILNMTSKKKQDNMLCVTATSAGQTPAQAPLTIPGNVPVQLVWCATARDRESPNGSDTTISVRESDVCFMRGLKERVAVSTNSGASWKWRRICFTAKGLNGSFGTGVDSLETSSGWVRLVANQNNTTMGNFLLQYMFKGTQGVDWSDAFVAKVDTNRITVKYDKLFRMSSGNSNGKYYDRKFWFPMNHNLNYSNDEAGETEGNDNHSTLGKAGMGDYYVVDFIICQTNSDGDRLIFNPEATLYWHEK